MRSPSRTPDLSGLVALARDPHLDLRPVILRVQTDLFVGAPARDEATIQAFAALATGLLPTVDDETVLVVAAKLAPCPDTPVEVMRWLISRGGAIRRAILARPEPASAPAPEGQGSREAQGARESGEGLDAGTAPARAARPAPSPTPEPAHGTALAAARASGALARDLLRRETLSAGDAAVLYLHADAERRSRIRAELGPLAALRHPAPPRAEAGAREALLAEAARGDAEGFAAALGRALGRPLPALDLGTEAGQEVLALALHAAGLQAEEAIRVFLTLDGRLARSVRAVFHLAALLRATPRAVALHLVEAVAGPETPRAPARHQPAMDPSGTASRAGAVGAGRERRAAAPRERRAG